MIAAFTNAHTNHFRRERCHHGDGLRVLEPQRIALPRWRRHVADRGPLSAQWEGGDEQ
jgi:hypothetical protein